MSEEQFIDPEASEELRRPTCPLCANQSFRQEEGKFDSAWGMTAHRVRMLICERCQYVLTFYDGNTIWDFD